MVIALLIETYEANNFPQENNLKVKGNPNRNSRSSVEKCIKGEGGVKGGNAAPELLWGPVDSTQVSPGPACPIPTCRMTGSATASQLKTWKQAWKTAKSVCSCKMNTYCGVLTLLLEYSVGLLNLMVLVFQLISSLLLFSLPTLFLISQIIFCYITYIGPINTWPKFFPLIFPRRFVVSLQFIHSIYVHNVTFLMFHGWYCGSFDLFLLRSRVATGKERNTRNKLVIFGRNLYLF